MLREALPKIISDTLPGPISQSIIERRETSVPNAIKCIYPCVMKQASGAMIEDMDGNAVAANYAIGVVDEALFAILDQQIDPTASLYAIRYYREPVRFASYVDKSSNGLFAEGGGEGAEGEPRSDFADTAAFLTGRTDASGNATFSFTFI